MYDIVFFTNQPAFYKINLYNEIVKEKKILVIYLAESSIARTADFTNGNMKFEYIILNKGGYEERNKVKTCLKLIKILTKIKYKLIITMGWLCIEDILIAFISPKKKNGLVMESSIYETVLTGYKKIIKKIILTQHTYAFVSGIPHKKIFEELKFKGKILITGGVGIFNRKERKIIKKEREEKKYLCIARLAREKNLEFLIETFNQNKKSLTIVGQGLLENKLKKMANQNINFLNHIPNEEIDKVYLEHDIFILPSKSEPWGLVIDEALYYGLPVIVSNKVGCNIDLVEELKTGEIYKFNDKKELNKIIDKINFNYKNYKKNIFKLDFYKRDLKQIKVYDLS